MLWNSDQLLITKLDLMTGLITSNYREQFLQASHQFTLNSGLFLTLSGFNLSIIYAWNGVYLIDFYGRDVNAFVSPSRTSVLHKLSFLIVHNLQMVFIPPSLIPYPFSKILDRLLSHCHSQSLNSTFLGILYS